MKPLRLLTVLNLLLLSLPAFAGEPFGAADSAQGQPRVTGIKAVHRNGQTFVTWTDVAPGEAVLSVTQRPNPPPHSYQNIQSSFLIGKGESGSH